MKDCVVMDFRLKRYCCDNPFCKKNYGPLNLNHCPQTKTLQIIITKLAHTSITVANYLAKSRI